MIQYLIDEIIESAKNNSAGTLLNNDGIGNVINDIINSRNLNPNFIDSLIDKYNSESGFICKSSDFIYILKPYLINNPINESKEKPEKDCELIEALYGDWHSECGDR